jgi:hypothetical protein
MKKPIKQEKKINFWIFWTCPGQNTGFDLRKVKNREKLADFAYFLHEISLDYVLKRRSRKNWSVEKKNREKTWVQSDFMAILLKNFFEKNRKKKIFGQKIFFFKSCSFDAETAAKKIFFFEKNFGGIFRPKFSMPVFWPGHVQKIQKLNFFLFYRFFHTFLNELRTYMVVFLDIAAF